MRLRGYAAARVYAVVFVGACVGGAARLAIDRAFDLGAWPWDIVAINLGGSALLGALMGWFVTHKAPWWTPGLGPGTLGGFTTFSAMASPHPDAPVSALLLLVGTLAGASIAAALGWRAAEWFALRRGGQRLPLDVAQIEAEVEGFDGDDAQSGAIAHDAAAQ